MSYNVNNALAGNIEPNEPATGMAAGRLQPAGQAEG